MIFGFNNHRTLCSTSRNTYCVQLLVITIGSKLSFVSINLRAWTFGNNKLVVPR